jgi:DNA-binding transcriptional ArsR family regulator
VSDLLRTVLEPRRQRILQLVWEEELSAGEIHRRIGEVTFGAISQHLKVLVEVGAVEVRKDGRQRLYLARRAALGPFRKSLEQMWNASLERLQKVAEAEEQARGPRPPSRKR